MKKIALILSMFIFTSTPVFASTNLMMSENLVLSDELLDDTYLMFGNGNIQSAVNGDLYIAGGNTTITGNVSEDLVVAGGKVTIMGDVGGDVRVVGGQVAVFKNIGDDLVVVGGQVDLGKDATVFGSLIATAGIVTIDGKVNEDVRGILGMLLLNGRVEKNVTVTIEDKLDISESAFVGGNLTYSGLVESEIPEGVVKGAVSFNKFERDNLLESLTYLYLIKKAFGFAAGLLILLLFVLIMPKGLVIMAEKTKENPLKSFGVGLLVMISLIVGSILLMATIIGIPLALIVLAILITIYFVTQVFVSIWLGSYVFKYKKISKGKLFLAGAVSMFFYHILGLIPFLGWALNLVLFFVGVGSIYMMKMEYWSYLRKKDML